MKQQQNEKIPGYTLTLPKQTHVRQHLTPEHIVGAKKKNQLKALHTKPGENFFGARTNCSFVFFFRT